MERATGVSLYFPPDRDHYAPDYKDLAFSKEEGRWRRFMEAQFDA